MPALTALNTDADAAHKGWHIETIYEYHARTLLMLIEFLTLNFRDAAGLPGDVKAVTDAEDQSQYRGVRNVYMSSYRGSTANAFGFNTWGFAYSLAYSVYTLARAADMYYAVGVARSSAWSDTPQQVQTLLKGYYENLGIEISLIFLPDTFGSATVLNIGVPMQRASVDFSLTAVMATGGGATTVSGGSGDVAYNVTRINKHTM
jgi:hypothetical protein